MIKYRIKIYKHELKLLENKVNERFSEVKKNFLL